MALTWNEQLQHQLIEKYGKSKGIDLYHQYAFAFTARYSDDYSVNVAISDIAYIEELSADKPLDLSFYLAEKFEHPLHLRIFQWMKAIPLSDILPMLENMGLRIYNERPNRLLFENERQVYISDFAVSYNKVAFEIDQVSDLFQDAFTHIYLGLCENDGFNKLILSASLSWRDIIILRAYAKYLRQVGFRFSQPYIESTLDKNASIAKDLVILFKTLHDPKNSSAKKAAEIEKNILTALDAVTSLDEDRILRRMLELIKATLRTNYFQTNHNTESKEYVSLKLNSAQVPELPLPVPLYEVFVYSPRFEAIHLRNAKVARGGIRWSDRPEDFRTEILGLMKAQKVKNAIIVPSGAKGGFVLKTQTPSRDEVVYCYKSFIRGLLDLTDNIVEDKIIPPAQVVCYDDPDTYLVVAADKGTASFSDIANAISAEYHYWLGDAFASGGATGYDHKKMGITARGAWESIKRHFRELNIDVMNSPITVVGIGDMSGDVFGNGMLYSKQIKLVAAFDHRHIFLDPDPDLALSYQERLRLFNLPTSSWADYQPALISKGGGVFSRSLKAITLSAEIKQLLALEETVLTPNELIRSILKSPVDLIYNGGIGTYVKATDESHMDVGDRTNDYCRVNGNELRSRVVGEGGNLGFTQLGRVEYALTGGLINTDFIDNSAGVDCSDHEVNLKILLNTEVHKGKLSLEKRNELLASLTQEVAQLVLNDNYAQALVMSFSAHHARRNLTLHQNYIRDLESLGVLNRHVEFLPDDKTIIERKSAGLGLTRPELAVLLAYSKIHIKNEILKSKLPEDPFLRQVIASAFPESIRNKYSKNMQDHTLHRDIIATQLSNQMVNHMGFTYIYRLQVETGATVEEIIKAYTVSTKIFNTHELQKSIDEFNFRVPTPEQYDMLFNMRNLINLSTRWFLHTSYLKDDLQNIIDQYGSHVKQLEPIIPDLMSGYTKEYSAALVDKFLASGLSKTLAQRIAAYRAMYTSLNITDVAMIHHFDLIKTAKVYFIAGERINLVWFRDQIAADSREGHWNILARLTLRDELDICQRAFTIAVMKNDHKDASAVKLIDKWAAENQRILHRWEQILEMIHSSHQVEYNMIFIAIRELLGLILTSQ